LVDWSPFIYTAGFTANDTINNGTITELYPVTADFTPTETGLNVCAYGQGSGYLCGNLTELDLHITVPNPWISSRPTVLNVNKVDLGAKGMVSKEDLGGPVYVENDNNGTVTSQALGHIVATNNDDPNHKFLYYMPIDKILGAKNTELLTHNFEEEKINDAVEIKYLEWNDTISIVDSLKAKKLKMLPGDLIYVGVSGNEVQECTASFVVKQAGKKLGMLTAGHCVADANRKRTSNVYKGTQHEGEYKLIGSITNPMIGDKDGNEFAFISTNPDVVPMPCITVVDKG